MRSPIRTVLTPETRVLLLSAGPPENDAELARLIAAGLDWRRLASLAQTERAVPVLWRRMAGISEVEAPREIADGFLLFTRIAEFRQAQLRARLVEVLDLLEAEGIQPVLLKGAALAATVYQGFLDRPMGDLDLLVREEDADLAWRTIADAGWRDIDSSPVDYAVHHHLAPLEAPDETGIRLEIHRELFPGRHPFLASAPEMRDRATPVEIDGRMALAPDVGDLVGHLVAHFGWSHGFMQGAWRTFLDLERLTRSGAIDWDSLAGDVAGTPLASSCYWTMRLAEGLAGIAIPDSALGRLRPGLSARTERLVARHFALQVVEGEMPRLPAPLRWWLEGLGFDRSSRGARSMEDKRARMNKEDPGTLDRRSVLQRLQELWAYARRVVQTREIGPSVCGTHETVGHATSPRGEENSSDRLSKPMQQGLLRNSPVSAREPARSSRNRRVDGRDFVAVSSRRG